jgi:hypothetical protein
MMAQHEQQQHSRQGRSSMTGLDQQQQQQPDMNRAGSMTPGLPLSAAAPSASSAPASARGSFNGADQEPQNLQGFPHLHVNTHPKSPTAADDNVPFEAFSTPTGGVSPVSSDSSGSPWGYSPGSGTAAQPASFGFNPQHPQQHGQHAQQQQSDFFSFGHAFGQPLDLDGSREPTFEDNFTIKAVNPGAARPSGGGAAGADAPGRGAALRRSVSQLLFGPGSPLARVTSTGNLQFPLLDPLAGSKLAGRQGRQGSSTLAAVCGALVVAMVLQSVGLESLLCALLPGFIQVPLLGLLGLVLPGRQRGSEATFADPTAAALAAMAASSPGDSSSAIIMQAMESASLQLQKQQQAQQQAQPGAGLGLEPEQPVAMLLDVGQLVGGWVLAVQEDPQAALAWLVPCFKIVAVVAFALLSHYLLLHLHSRLNPKKGKSVRHVDGSGSVRSSVQYKGRQGSEGDDSWMYNSVDMWAVRSSGGEAGSRSGGGRSAGVGPSGASGARSGGGSKGAGASKKRLLHHHHHHFHDGSMKPLSEQ